MGSVFLDNVDDYLAPSQACVNPLFTSDRAPGDAKKASNDSNSGGINDGNSKHDAGAGAGAGVERASVKPRRKRVVRRKASGAGGSIGSSVGLTNDTNNGALASQNAMDIDDDLGTASASLTPVAQSSSPIGVGGTTTTSRKRPPIALSYKGQDDAPCPETDTSNGTIISAAVPKQKKATTVSVADCLACSGCVTSAEAVLVQSHSISTLRQYVKNNTDASDDKRSSSLLVFTISPASLADLVRHLYGAERDGGGRVGDSSATTTPRVVLGRLATFLHRQFGARLVIDGSYVQQLSLVESAEEFCARYLASKQKKSRGWDAGDANMMDTDSAGSFPLATPSIALSATETRYLLKKADNTATNGTKTEGVLARHEAGRDERLDRPDHMANSSPVLTSSCPGFVCYVEKTAPAVIPHLSTAKSPMACSGALVKHLIAPWSRNAAKIYHVAIMPCHDKKLEAGRKDLAWERGGDGSDAVPDVDLVLTTSELLTILSDATAESKASASAPAVTDEMDIDAKNESAPAIRQHLEGMAATQPSQSIDNITMTRSNGATLLSLEDNVSANSVPFGSSSNNVQMIGSGGYAEFCFRYAARKMFGFCIPDEESLPWKRVSKGRSDGTDNSTASSVPVRRRRTVRGGSGSIAHSDMSEVVLYQLADRSYSLRPQPSDGQKPKAVLKFATAYGFKNVQLVLLKLGKRGEATNESSTERTPDYFDFIEVMACPSGCLNGGGQIRDDENGAKREAPAETRERVGQNQSIINAIGMPRSSVGISNDLVSEVCTGDNPSFPSGVFGKEAKKMLHTRFHVVPKLELNTGATAGVALDDTVW